MAYCAIALWLDNCVLLVKACRQGHKQLWGRVGGGNNDAKRVSCDIHGSKQAISNVAEKYTSGIAKILTAPRLGETLKAKYNFLLYLYNFFIVAPCILITIKFLSLTNAPLYYTCKMLKYTVKISHVCFYMFQSIWTIIREPMPNLAKVTILWRYSVKIRR